MGNKKYNLRPLYSWINILNIPEVTLIESLLTNKETEIDLAELLYYVELLTHVTFIINKSRRDAWHKTKQIACRLFLCYVILIILIDSALSL